GSGRGVNGVAVVRASGDRKRQARGPSLAEPIADEGVPPDVFMTENLWGVGSTAPYLHDGRATTLTEAILEHGGESQRSRDAFVALPLDEQKAMIAFLENLVLFKLAEPADFRGNRHHIAPPAAPASRPPRPPRPRPGALPASVRRDLPRVLRPRARRAQLAQDLGEARELGGARVEVRAHAQPGAGAVVDEDLPLGERLHERR